MLDGGRLVVEVNLPVISVRAEDLPVFCPNPGMPL